MERSLSWNCPTQTQINQKKEKKNPTMLKLHIFMLKMLKSSENGAFMQVVRVYLLLYGGVFLFHVPFLFGGVNNQLIQLQDTEEATGQSKWTASSSHLSSLQSKWFW